MIGSLWVGAESEFVVLGEGFSREQGCAVNVDLAPGNGLIQSTARS